VERAGKKKELAGREVEIQTDQLRNERSSLNNSLGPTPFENNNYF